MKKVLSFLLAIWLGLSAMLSVPLVGLAEDESLTIVADTATTVALEPGVSYRLHFTVPEDGYYQLVDQPAADGIRRSLYASAENVPGAKNWNFVQENTLLTFPAQANMAYTVNLYTEEVVGFSSVLTLEKHTHPNQTATVVKAATCTEPGTIRYTCPDCSYTGKDTLPVDPDNHPQELSPVCTACGQDKSTGDLQLNRVVRLPYQEKGTYRFYRFCPAEDGAYYFTGAGADTERLTLTVLDELGQKLTGSAPQLTGGKTYYVAIFADTEISGKKLTNLIVQAHTHSMALVQQYAQTCAQDGYSLYRCKTCGAEEKRNLRPATGAHQYENFVCTFCGQVDPDSLQRIPLVLGESQTVTARYCREKIDFTFTPTETGSYAFSVDASKQALGQLQLFLSDGENRTTVSNNALLKLKADTAYHISVRFYSSNGNEYCGNFSVCLQRHNHDYQLTSNVEPTCRVDGKKIYTCSLCKEQVTVVIPHVADDHYYNRQGVCTGCGQPDPLLKAEPAVAVLDTEYSIENSGGHHTYAYVFIPSQAGYYQFLATGDFALYTADGEKIPIHANETGQYYAYLERNAQVRMTLHTSENRTLRLEIHAHTHAFSERTMQPSCGSEGYVLAYCNDCGYGQYRSFLPATDTHSFSKQVVQPTCVSMGYTRYTCNKCGYTYIAAYTALAPDRHSDGFENGVCTACGRSFYQPKEEGTICTDEPQEAVLSDQQIAYTFVPEADGVYCFSVEAPVSSAVQRAVLDHRGQVLADGTETLYAYCQKGSAYRLCGFYTTAQKRLAKFSVTGHTHTFKTDQTVALTCTQDGYKKENCVCGDTRIVNFRQRTGKHNMVWDSQQASCGRAGYRKYYCEDCGYVEKKTIYPATGAHHYRYGVCSYCGQTQYPRRYVPGGVLTVEQPAVIEYLGDTDTYGYSYTFTPAADGYYQFSMHGNLRTEILLTGGGQNSQNRDKSDFLIADLQKGTTYTIKVWPGVYSGSCVAALSVATHTHNLLDETVLPTCGRDGYTRQTCTVCNYTRKTNVQPATGQHTFIDDYCTGCNSPFSPEAITGTVTTGTTCTVQPGITNRIAFTPTMDGVYAFYSVSDFAPKATVRDGGNNNLSRAFAARFKNLQFDSPVEGKNFAVAAELKKGVTYYLVTTPAMHSYCVGVMSTVAHDYTLTQRHKNSCEKVTQDVYTCTICGHTMGVDNMPDGHQEDMVKLIPPTYDQDAKGEFVCWRCGKKSVHTSPLCKSHYYIDEEQPATDMLPKCTIHYCQKCGEVGYRQSRCKEHKMEVDTQKATCVAPGYVKTYCVRCGYCTKKETIPQLQHKYQVEKYAPSCTQDGYKCRTCTLCMKTEYYDKKPKLGHKWGSAKVVRKATYAAAGKKRYTCDRCGATKDASISKRTVATVSGISIKSQKKGFSLKWKRASDVTGYRIQYSTDSKFSAKKTKSITIKSAKTTQKAVSKLSSKKKYYVRVRAYKTEKGKTYNSSWSKVYTVKTK